MANEHFFEVKLVRSPSGRPNSQRLTLLGLGLTKMGKVVHLKDTPPIRGMIFKVVHLVSLARKSGAMPVKAQLQRSRSA